MEEDLKYRLTIIDNSKKKNKNKEPLEHGTIVFCKGHDGTDDFIGIVYEYGVLEFPYGSNAYINTTKPIHLGDRISYWTIEKVYKNAKLILDESEC